MRAAGSMLPSMPGCSRFSSAAGSNRLSRPSSAVCTPAITAISCARTSSNASARAVERRLVAGAARLQQGGDRVLRRDGEFERVVVARAQHGLLDAEFVLDRGARHQHLADALRPEPGRPRRRTRSAASGSGPSARPAAPAPSRKAASSRAGIRCGSNGRRARRCGRRRHRGHGRRRPLADRRPLANRRPLAEQALGARAPRQPEQPCRPQGRGQATTPAQPPAGRSADRQTDRPTRPPAEPAPQRAATPGPRQPGASPAPRRTPQAPAAYRRAAHRYRDRRNSTPADRFGAVNACIGASTLSGLRRPLPVVERGDAAEQIVVGITPGPRWPSPPRPRRRSPAKPRRLSALPRRSSSPSPRWFSSARSNGSLARSTGGGAAIGCTNPAPAGVRHASSRASAPPNGSGTTSAGSASGSARATPPATSGAVAGQRRRRCRSHRLGNGQQYVAEAELVAVGQLHLPVTRHPRDGAVDEHAVGAEIGQHVAPAGRGDHAMRLGQLPLGIGQDPVIAGCAADG